MSAILGLAFKVERAMGLLTAQGLSTRAIQLALSASGLGIRRQKVTDYVRLIRGAPEREKLLRSAAGTGVVPRAAITNMDFSQPTKYRAYGNQIVENKLTGETFSRPGSVFSDELKDPLDYESDMIEQNEKNPSDPALVVIGFEVTDLYHNRDKGY